MSKNRLHLDKIKQIAEEHIFGKEKDKSFESNIPKNEYYPEEMLHLLLYHGGRLILKSSKFSFKFGAFQPPFYSFTPSYLLKLA